MQISNAWEGCLAPSHGSQSHIHLLLPVPTFTKDLVLSKFEEFIKFLGNFPMFLSLTFLFATTTDNTYTVLESSFNFFHIFEFSGKRPIIFSPRNVINRFDRSFPIQT